MHDHQYTIPVSQINGTAAGVTLPATGTESPVNRSAISLNFNRRFVEQNKKL